MKFSVWMKKVKLLSSFAILIYFMCIICVSVAWGDFSHGTAEQWITESMLTNIPPAEYRINKNTQAKAQEGLYNKYFLKEDLQEVYIEVEENNLNYLLQNAKDEPYVMINKVTIGDTSLEYCGLKTKGDYTLQHSYDENPGSDRFSFTVHFGKYINKENYGEKQTFYGCEKISFNNFFFDKSMLKEFLSYKLLEEMGLPVPQYGLAKLYINGEYYGVYFMVEALEESVLEQYYDVKDVDGYLDKPKDTTLNYYEILERPALLCGNDEAKLADIQDVLPIVLEWNKKLNQLSAGEDFEGNTIDVNSETYLELLGQIMNVDEAVRYFATHSWLCQTDSMFVWLKNYGLYVSEEGVSTIIPWDYDLSFGCHGNNAEDTANYDLDIMYAPNLGAATGNSPEEIYARYPLFKVIYQNEQLMERYYTYMGECSQIAALGGIVQSTGKVYEPVYLNSYIEKLENVLLEAAEEELAEHVYYMNGIQQPDDIKKAIPNLRKIVTMRAVGVKLQLEKSDSRVCGKGCDLKKVGNGISGGNSTGGKLTIVDEETGIYATAEYEKDGISPMLIVYTLGEDNRHYIQITQALNTVASDWRIYQMKNTKKPVGNYELTIPVSQEELQSESLVFYAYSNGMLTKLDMVQKDNLFTGISENIEYLVIGHTGTGQNTANRVLYLMVAILGVLMAGLLIAAYMLFRLEKKAFAVVDMIVACLCLVMLIIVLMGMDRQQKVQESDVIEIDMTTESETQPEYETECLSGTGWWENHEISEDYFLAGDGSITLDIYVDASNDLEGNGFCVELYDDEGNYFTTTSLGEAWYTGTEGTISGITEAKPIVPGSTIRVVVTREGDTYTIEYTDKESGEQLIKFVGAEKGEFSDTVKLRFMAHVGVYTLNVLEIKQGDNIHE